ncbi:ferredoxin [Mycobacterium sp. SMC-18]|uniref:ferredoxin n=1 Tax=Mycobacterium sp. SMC-18 TaxID=3381629 RepID=UPI003875D201
MKVAVNYKRCEGHAVCAAMVPNVFELGDDDEQVRIVNDSPEPDDQEQVATAAKRCPVEAITVTED